jgi:hypothetical protein
MNEFNWIYYLENNPDLFDAGINTFKKALKHYNKYGIREGRSYLKKNINSHLLHPITFSIPNEKIIKYEPNNKTKVLSNLIPGNLSTYIYNNENFISSYFK